MKRFARFAPVVLTAGLLSFGLPSRSAPASPSTAALSRTLPELKFEGVTLNDCIEFLRDVSGANINVDWKGLAESNVNKETPITVRLYGVPLRKALSVVLSEAAGGDALTFYSEDNVIEVTTKATADKMLYVKVYPVDDLLVEVPDFADAPKFDLQSATQQGSQGGGSGGSGGGGQTGGLFPSGGSSSTKEEAVKTKDQRAEELVQLVIATIQPDVWRDAGGTATVKYFNGSLVVSAPRSVHEALGGSID